MKKNVQILIVFIVTSFLLTSCGHSSFETDAKKVAELQCKAEKLMREASSGDMSIIEESQELVKEAAELGREMEEKYSSESDKKEFTEAYLKELGHCK